MSALARGGVGDLGASRAPLAEFGYGDVTLEAGPEEDQREQTLAVLLGLSDDALLKPFRQMAGRAAPGEDLGGWYRYDPNFNYKTGDAGFAPGSTFGQWISALARSYAITGSPESRARVLRLNGCFAEAISGDYFEKTRFPAYSYDKLVCGLIDSHEFAGDGEAFSILDRMTSLAAPHLPPRAVPREKAWRPDKDVSYTWDESYTMPENLLLADQRGAGSRYRELALNYFEDASYFDPLARGEDPMAGRHAYSYVNALSSAMQAYLILGSEKHLAAAKHGFDLLAAQSFATGGWGPDEQLREPASDDLFLSLTRTHNSFETPCGTYAHCKLTRYLLRATRDPRYGDSMERVLYNSLRGAKPLSTDGRAFYYADYNFKGKRVYSDHRWPCCSGTLPQIAADVRINTFFRDGGDVYVNLYLPSTLRWRWEGADFSLRQQSQYPRGGSVVFTMEASRAAEFGVLLRIPAWAESASLSVNGEPHTGKIEPGRFVRLDRQWRSGDRITLSLPMELRLEAINRRHPEVVALMHGPTVLFALGEGLPEFSRKELLSAAPAGESRWMAHTARGGVEFVPVTGIGDADYSTYVRTA